MNTHGQKNKTITSVAILGPGAVGGFLAAVLWKNGVSVSCITKSESAMLIEKEGISLESTIFGNFVAHPKGMKLLEYEPDILFVTTKGPFLSDALRRVVRNSFTNTVIIPLLNGVEHVDIIRENLGPHIAVGMISVEVTRPNKYQIIHSSPHVRIEIASDNDIPESKLKMVAKLLSDIGIETQVIESEVDVIWRKLVRLNAIASTTAASQLPVGFVRTNPWWRKKLKDCVYECVKVAEEEGAEINPKTIMRQIDLLPEELSTSLQRDIAKGLPSELESIPGAILRLGKKHNITCRTIQEIFEMIKERNRI